MKTPTSMIDSKKYLSLYTKQEKEEAAPDDKVSKAKSKGTVPDILGLEINQIKKEHKKMPNEDL